MPAILDDLRATLRPARTSPLGPLPPLLVTLTAVTGLVDSFSYLVLGHVFVANMTGNVLLLGLALVGAPGFSASSSLVALAAFALGGVAGGVLGHHLGPHRGRHLSSAAALQVVVFCAAASFAGVVGQPVPRLAHTLLVAGLAAAMGLQNATARALAVPDLTTTVLTQTITGLAAENPLAAGSRSGRRLVAVAAMLCGAIVGGALALHGHAFVAPALAAALAGAVALASWRSARPASPWSAAMA